MAITLICSQDFVLKAGVSLYLRLFYSFFIIGLIVFLSSVSSGAVVSREVVSLHAPSSMVDQIDLSFTLPSSDIPNEWVAIVQVCYSMCTLTFLKRIERHRAFSLITQLTKRLLCIRLPAMWTGFFKLNSFCFDVKR